jgi:hypothetical protein
MTEIISSAKQVELLEKEVQERDTTIKVLNDKINRLSTKVDESGCKITNAMGLDFEVSNPLADFYLEQLEELIKFMEIRKVFPANISEIKNLIEKRGEE